MNNKTYITELIASVENTYLKLLWNKCSNFFESQFIPSHDQYHHLRVWNYVKSLIIELAHYKNFEKAQIEQLIIACFFHDTGLSIVLDEKHGIESKKLCQAFINENYSNKESIIDEILWAVEKHDDKNYKTITITELHSDVLSILSVCDDIDAFGYTGIYRYVEIYLMRGIQFEALGKEIKKNVRKRFLHFIDLYGKLESFSALQEARFAIIDNFFIEFQKAIENGEENFQYEIVKHIKTNLIDAKLNVRDYISSVSFENQKEYIKDFYNKLNLKLFPEL